MTGFGDDLIHMAGRSVKALKAEHKQGWTFQRHKTNSGTKTSGHKWQNLVLMALPPVELSTATLGWPAPPRGQRYVRIYAEYMRSRLSWATCGQQGCKKQDEGGRVLHLRLDLRSWTLHPLAAPASSELTSCLLCLGKSWNGHRHHGNFLTTAARKPEPTQEHANTCSFGAGL